MPPSRDRSHFDMASTENMIQSATTAVTSMPSTSFLNLSGLKASAVNITSAYIPTASAKDLAYFPFRVASDIDRAVFRTFPRFVLRNIGIHRVGEFARTVFAGRATEAMAEAAGAAGVELAAGNAVDAGWSAFFAEAFQASTFKSYWGMLHYLTSRWAFTCFVMALIINRISVYGASRQRIFLTWNRRLALRLIPIMLFVAQIHHLLQAIRCQSAPQYALYRHGDMNKYSLLDWSTDGGFLHTMSSTILFAGTDEGACAAVGMSRSTPDVRARYGSFSLLWPTFLKLSLSHLVENLSCSMQQIPVMTEVGMSVFEHSLAFSEAETMISHVLGLGMFGLSRPSNSTTATNSTMAAAQFATIPASGSILALNDAAAALAGPHLLDRINVPVEVLIVALLSCCNSLSSHIISILGKQRSLRLINTAFWGIAFMSAFVWGFCTTSAMVRAGEDGRPADNRLVSGLLHFPTVAIIGFLPHMTILLGIFVCGVIYLLALLLTAVSLGTNPHIPQPTSLKERFSIAHDNLQAAVQVRGINIRWQEDFYTALLRVGFAALTAASEAVFLNEGRSVEMRQFTWLEEERLDEIEKTRLDPASIAGSSHFQIAEQYGVPPITPGGTDNGGHWESGYAKERKIEQGSNANGELQGEGTFVYPNPRSAGVGALQRTTRFYLLFIYIRGILFLVGGWMGFGLGVVLDRIGITARPTWLRKVVGRSLRQVATQQGNLDRRSDYDMLDFWRLTDEGKLALPPSEDFDIEPEMRKRIIPSTDGESVEQALDDHMYNWWKTKGWFGTKDESGDYNASVQGDFNDTTSMVSMSTNATTTDEEAGWESESDGRRTPTQASSKPSWSFADIEASSIPEEEPIDTPLDAATLARLLNPPDRSSREEARILSAHLAASVTTGSSTSPSQIMTRSRYRRQLESERARVLLAGRAPNRPSNLPTISLYNSLAPPTTNTEPRPLTPAEEAEVLESLILSRRKPNRPGGGTDDDDKNIGPLCVVCQSAPRTIIAWPCRCLTVCEDCRVSLALHNTGSCVTCRRNVQGFVRLWVP